MEYARNLVSQGKLRVPCPPAAYTQLLYRDDAEQAVQKYLLEVYTKANRAADGKFPMLGCSGMKGIGKTAMLVHTTKALLPGLVAGGSQIPAAAAVYVTFNGGGAQRDVFFASSRRQPEIARAFGHMLLQSIGIDLEMALPLTFTQCIEIYRSLLKLPENGLFCICVDEAGDLDDPHDRSVRLTSKLFSALMKEMDKRDGRLAFVFAHIRQDVLNKEATDSGRQVIPLPLRALPLDCWRSLNPDAATAAEQDAGLHQLLLACSGHPRSLVDGLPAAQAKVPNLFTAPNEANLILAKDEIANTCKFVDIPEWQMGSLVRRWFSVGKPPVDELQRDGVLLTLPGEPGVQLLHPLLLHCWAQRQSDMSTLAYHLQQAYCSDCVLGNSAEKHMEAVMYHYEAVLRCAARGQTFTLGSFYRTRHMSDPLRATRVRAHMPFAQRSTDRLVFFVDDFGDIAQVVEYLKKGYIVVSKAQQEAGIEYLSPYINQDTGKLIVAATQCKFVNWRTSSWTEIRDRIVMATKLLDNVGVQCFPVVYTTVDQGSMWEATYADGVYFIEADLFDFTRKLGVLRLHTLKLGAFLASKYPWLRGASVFSGAGQP
jgi:hypothetical protein